MKPSAFEYARAQSVEEALEVLAMHGEEARILAGGQSLMAMLNMRLLTPRCVLDVSRIEALRHIDVHHDEIEVGAGVTQAELLRWPQLAERVPLLAAALPHVGHYQTRARGTVCGSIAHADPSSELPLCLATLQAHVVLRSTRGVRALPAAEFQTGLLSTARAPDELIVAVRFPLAAPGDGYAFREFSLRHGDFALVACAASMSATQVRLGVGGYVDRPLVQVWPRAEVGTLTERLDAMAGAVVADDDVHASGAYRQQLLRHLGREVIEEALACAG